MLSLATAEPPPDLREVERLVVKHSTYAHLCHVVDEPGPGLEVTEVHVEQMRSVLGLEWYLRKPDIVLGRPICQLCQ